MLPPSPSPTVKLPLSYVYWLPAGLDEQYVSSLTVYAPACDTVLLYVSDPVGPLEVTVPSGLWKVNVNWGATLLPHSVGDVWTVTVSPTTGFAGVIVRALASAGATKARSRNATADVTVMDVSARRRPGTADIETLLGDGHRTRARGEPVYTRAARS